MNNFKIFALSIFVTALTTGSLSAGVITGFSWSSGIASVGVNPIAPAVVPNNDDHAGPSPNLVFIPQKNYVGIGPVDIEFTVVDSGGVTEYVFLEGVFNGTGIPWTDYHIQLGFGMGTAYTPSPSGDGLDFDDPDLSSPFSFAPFTTVVIGEDDIDAYNGIVLPFTYVFPFAFHIDVPDGITSFTVRQYPTIDGLIVPEPSGAILGSGILGVLTALRRRRR